MFLMFFVPLSYSIAVIVIQFFVVAVVGCGHLEILSIVIS